MKKYYLVFLAVLFCVLSCSKKHDNDGLSQDIKNFVPQAVIDSMRKWGLMIYEGKTPPTVAGIYNFSRNYCTFDNSGFNRANTYFSDYRLRFRDQNNSELTIALDYKALSVQDTASGVGSFIAGTDNNFTVFVDVKGVLTGVDYKGITFFSGTKTSTGIKSLQWGYYIKEKGPDPTNLLAKAGTSRIFIDQDSFSDINANYRVAPGIRGLGEN